ncbi:MAG: wax ester/triacylglycerol synthase family O-acyltransferase, partial [Burkholderiaceae bacterium]
WNEADEVDLEFHVRHIALPQPGDWRQLMIQIARLHARPLDRSRPLWEAYVIEGLDHIPDLPRGSFAIFTKMHHAAVDGIAAIDVMRRLHDGQHEPTGSLTESAANDATASEGELVARAVVHALERVGRTSLTSLNGAARATGILLDQLAQKLNPAIHGDGKGAQAPGFARAPTTRFNHPISANRAIEAVGLPLDGIKRIRSLVPGATINDVFLAVCGGALRRYLASKSELPERSLVALMPISVRAEGAGGDGGNQVGGVAVPLCTDVADPVDRLRAVKREAAQSKQQADVVGRDLPMTIVESVPHFIADVVVRNALFRQLNTTVSNVRGPETALTFAGARLMRLYPISMVADNVGHNHTGVSYDGTLWISVVACRNMLPDPAFYAQCLRNSYDELLMRADAAVVRDTAAPTSIAAARKAGDSAAKHGRARTARVRVARPA